MYVEMHVWNVTVWCGAEQGFVNSPCSSQHVKKHCSTEILVIHLCNTLVKAHVLGTFVHMNAVCKMW